MYAKARKNLSPRNQTQINQDTSLQRQVYARFHYLRSRSREGRKESVATPFNPFDIYSPHVTQTLRLKVAEVRSRLLRPSPHLSLRQVKKKSG